MIATSLFATLVAFLGLALTLTGANPIDIEKRAGPSGTIITPAGGSSYSIPNGVIPFEYATVAASWTKTRSVNVFLTKTDVAPVYNHTLATDLTFQPGQSRIKAWFRVPRDFAPFHPGARYQIQVVETQIIPGTTQDEDGAKPFVAAAPFVNLNWQ